MDREPGEVHPDSCPGGNWDRLQRPATLEIHGVSHGLLSYSKTIPAHAATISRVLSDSAPPLAPTPNSMVIEQESELGHHSLRRLDDFLKTPLSDEIDANASGDLPESSRSFLDGPELTLADCNLLPKLHILKVVAKKYRGFEIPAEMTGVWRYLNCAYQREEFTSTCPAGREIEFAYLNVAKQIK
ncbi:chloride intracellular channel protein 5-like [Odontesthes bonariensis]|uniref:chloride intracellular channel protein 5 n=1 Tax=Odontesthes bonariensis TaxID=219752 RepID=UPI003F58D6FD